jgi:SET domain-containing protein
VRVISPGNSGLFAAEIIKPYEFIGEYIGYVQTIDEFNDTLDPSKGTYIVDRNVSYTAFMRDPNLTVDLIVDALHIGSIMRFANHSCNPNSEIVVIWRGPTPTLFLRAISMIEPGDQITFDYNWKYQQGSKAHRCACNPSSAPHYIERGVPTTIADHLRNAPKDMKMTKTARRKKVTRVSPKKKILLEKKNRPKICVTSSQLGSPRHGLRDLPLGH